MSGSRRALPPLALALALLAAWELYARRSGVDALVLPAPTAIAGALWSDRALLWANFVVTAVEVAGGLAVALPAALSGARIAVAVAVIGAVFAEDAGASEGLGFLMGQAVPRLETRRAWAAVVVLAAFAVALFTTLGALERRLSPES